MNTVKSLGRAMMLLVCGGVILAMPACASGQSSALPTSLPADNASGTTGPLPSQTPVNGSEKPSLPPVQLPPKGNDKLDSALNQLVAAEKNGEAAQSAASSGIEIIDGNVRVIIDCTPGSVEAVSQAATAAGATIELVYEDMIQALVPLNAIEELSGEPGVKIIRLPQYALPAGQAPEQSQPDTPLTLILPARGEICIV